MDLLIREARPDDDEAIGELLVNAFITAYAKKMPEVIYGEDRKRDLRSVAEKRRHARVWVGELEGRVVGTVSLFPPGAPGSEAWLPNAADLRHLATDPNVHGRGLSRPLLDVAENAARELGASAICLHVRRGAVGVGRIYESRGYRRTPDGDLDLLPAVFLEAYVLTL